MIYIIYIDLPNGNIASFGIMKSDKVKIIILKGIIYKIFLTKYLDIFMKLFSKRIRNNNEKIAINKIITILRSNPSFERNIGGIFKLLEFSLLTSGGNSILLPTTIASSSIIILPL